MKNLTLISLFLSFFASAVAQTPAPDQNKKILLYGGIAHIGNGEAIENSLIILEDGKILTIEDASNIRIDISDAECYWETHLPRIYSPKYNSRFGGY